MLGKRLDRRYVLTHPVLETADTAVHQASRDNRKSLSEQTRDLIFQGTQRINREIDELKRIVNRTEGKVREQVIHQVREIMAERNRQVDVRDLTVQVYRNMERMIKIERERRGM